MKISFNINNFVAGMYIGAICFGGWSAWYLLAALFFLIDFEFLPPLEISLGYNSVDGFYYKREE